MRQKNLAIGKSMSKLQLPPGPLTLFVTTSCPEIDRAIRKDLEGGQFLWEQTISDVLSIRCDAADIRQVSNHLCSLFPQETQKKNHLPHFG